MSEEDFMTLSNEFHTSGKFLRSINSTLICPVAKKKGAENITDFRSIRLVSTTYKVSNVRRAAENCAKLPSQHFSTCI